MRLGRSVAAVAAGVLLVGVSLSRAEISSDRPAAIVTFPKLVVDLNRGIDTMVRLSNTSQTPLRLHCFWVDATPRCDNGPGSCISGIGIAPTCAGTCVDNWTETDFRLTLTGNQPIGWRISQGMRDCLSTSQTDPSQPCFPLDGVTRIGPGGQSNAVSRIPPVPHDEFVGYLQCIAIDDNGAPVERNDLQGEALITRTDTPLPLPPAAIDVDSYNGVGLSAIPGTNDFDGNLCLGGCSPGKCSVTKSQSCFSDGDCPAGERCSVQCQSNPSCPRGPEYDGCPNILVLDHFFDGGVDPVSDLPVVTDLTLVPCTQDYLRQNPEKVTVQFLVFNEFEQRFSTSRPVTCFKEFQLSNIDTSFNENSIFSAAVNGTLTGQTRIRGVADDKSTHGQALMGVAQEYRCAPTSTLDNCGIVSTAAFNLHSQGRRPQADLLLLAPE